MDASLKKILRGISLELRHELEGWHDKKTGVWNPGDLERRLNEIGVWSDRLSKPLDEMPHLSAEDKAARRLVDGYLQLRAEAGVERTAAVAEFVRESAYTWANRLFALRCMEARSIIEEVILQKAAYAGRSLVHQRFLRKNPDASKGEDDGLFAVLFAEFAVRSQELPALFDPKSPAVALRPSVAALKRCVALLSGTETVRGQDPATDEVFAAPDAFGWAYQYWNAEEQKRVFEMVRTKKGAKIERADIVPATQFYTEPYMVKFLVQNSLGALWMGMFPDSKLCEQWEYYVKDTDRPPATRKPVREFTFLDPAEGSGHFHLEAFDVFYVMYVEEAAREGRTLTPREIAATILNQNLYGIDIDGRSVQIATAALWMKAKERAPELEAEDLTSFHEHLVATNIRLPKGKDHLELFLQKHPEDQDLRPALELVFQGLEHADELGALLQIAELVDAVLRRLKEEADKNRGTSVQTGLFEPTLIQTTLPVAMEDYDKWKRAALGRLQSHFEAEAQVADPAQAFFGKSASRSLTFFTLLARRYDVVAANPPYMGSKNMSPVTRPYVERYYAEGKRDLYSAFICRARSFLADGGFMAMVTLGSWLTKDSFLKLRCLLLESTSLKSFVLLGRYAFSEVDPPGLPVLFVVQRKTPMPNQEVKVVTVGRPMECLAQATLIKSALAEPQLADDRPGAYKLQQTQFAALPGKLILVGLTPQLLRMLIEETPLEKALIFCEPATTGNNFRYVRYGWEVADINRWFLMSKGGGHRRWKGLEIYRIDWAHKGARIKAEPGSYVRNEDAMFKAGITFTAMSRHGISFREMSVGMTFGKAGPGILRRNGDDPGFLALLNSSVYQFLLRNLSPGASVSLGNVSRLPLPIGVETLKALESLRVRIAEKDVEDELLENEFVPTVPNPKTGATLKALANSIIISHLARFVAALTVEQAINEKAIALLALSQQSQEAVRARFGAHPGELPAIKAVDAHAVLENVPADTAPMLAESLTHLIPTKVLPDVENGHVAQIKQRFTSAASTKEEEVSDEDVDLEESEDEDQVQDSNRLPAENVLEEIAINCGVHPVSAYCVIAEGILRENWNNAPEIERLTEDRFTVLVLQLLGHHWPKQLKAGESLPAWADQDGVIPLTSGGGETPLIDRVSKRLAEDFPGGNVATFEREFEDIVGVSLEQWLAGPFFERHISQFRKRPIAWQLETIASRQAAVPGSKGKKKRAVAGEPVFACLVYYQKLDVDLLPKIRTQYVGLLRGGFETEFRTLEQLANPTGDQQARRLDLEQWTGELQAFDQLLEEVSAIGFCPKTNDNTFERLLRQYGINDALLSLTSSWLRRLSETMAKGPMSNWVEVATKTELHPDLSKWLQDSMSNLNHFCAVLGPKQPDEKSPPTDPTSKELAPLVCHHAKSMLEGSLKLGCDRWWKPFDEAVLEPLRQESKTAKNEVTKINEELETEGLPFQRRNELGERKHELKTKIKSIKADHDEKSEGAKKVRRQIEKWVCLEAETWEAWLCAQPLFDEVASLDGQRPPPQSIADFITQESRYAPDINDGVRVNIAPIQKAGLLHADVLDSKDADEAIADRAEWRADERRWVREGKLPQPGWWKGTT